MSAETSSVAGRLALLEAGFHFRGGLSLWKPTLKTRDLGYEVIITLTIEVPHADTGEVITVSQQRIVRADLLLELQRRDDKKLRSYIHAFVQDFVAHEVDESFCFLGKPVRNPHPENS